MKMLVRAATLVVIGALIVLVAGHSIVAAGGDQVSRKDFALVGEVISVDLDSGSLVVAPSTGFGFGGLTQVTIYTNEGTRFSPAGTDLATLNAGDEIRSSGRLIGGQLVAEVITLAP